MNTKNPIREIIRDEMEINAILDQVFKSDTHLLVHLKDLSQDFFTTIKSKTPSHLSIIVSLESDFQRIKIIDTLYLSFHLNNAEFFFESQHYKIKMAEEKKEDIKISIPQFLVKIQQRQHFRVLFNEANALQITYESIPPITGTTKSSIMDLSIGGCGIVISDKDTNLYEPKVELKNIKIKLPNGKNLVLTGIVRSITQGTSLNGNIITKIGIQYKEMSTADENLLSEYIFQLQREMLLKMSKAS